MKKIIASIFVIALLVLITGCGDKKDGDQTSTASAGKSFIGGSEGLKMEFTPGAPPDEVYDQDNPFGINIRIENAGEYDIDDPADATLSITGIYPLDFGTTAAQLTKNVPTALYGAELDLTGSRLDGAVANVDFANLQHTKEIVGNPEFVIRANLCYKYGTTITSKVCILEDLLGRTRKRGEESYCNPNTEQDYENSGAPVQISSFKQSVVGSDRLSFQFNIKHVGTGEISKVGSECAASNSLAEKEVVYVKIDTGLQGLSCTGLTDGTATEGYTKLYGGAGSEEKLIVCTQQLGAGDLTDFEKPIKMELTYDYEEYIDRNLIVRHLE